MMEALKVMTYSKVSLPTRNWDSAFFMRSALARQISSRLAPASRPASASMGNLMTRSR